MEFRLLGPVEVRHAGQPVDIGHGQRRRVLAVLAMDANTVVTVDQIIERVWADRTPRSAAETVYSYISYLRQAMAAAGEQPLARESGGYRLAVAPSSVDVHRFRDLLSRARANNDGALFDEALRLWHGEPFPGLDTPWAIAERTKLEQERYTAELDHTDLRLRHGEHIRLLPELQARAEANPLDERLAAQLMLALYRGGRSADALNYYQRIRQQLADKLGVGPGPELQERYEKILRNAPELRPAERPSTLAHPPVPRQLPAHTPHFVGRAAELRQLSALCDNAARDGGAIVISAFGGTGGIGKTSLALHWAHLHAHQFPDGQLFVNLLGFDPGGRPVSPAAVIRGFLDALGLAPTAIPTEFDAQVELYRNLVTGKRMLIVLDNARDAGQIAPLLPGSPTCTVLVTSRQRLASLAVTHGARLVDVDSLSDIDARALLADRVGTARLNAEPDAVAVLLASCAGLPLALSIVAARAADHPRFPLAALADELRHASSRLDALDTGDLRANLRAVLSWSRNTLSPQAASVFGFLGVAPGPDISLAAVAALTGLSTECVRLALRELETVSLAQQHSPRRYRMHDLIRLYAREHANREMSIQDRTAASRRLVDFYLHTAYTGDRLLYPQRDPIEISVSPDTMPFAPLTLEDAKEALRWFDVEYHCLVGAQQLAMAQGWDTAVWQLAWTLDTFHYRRHLHDRVACWRAGLAAVQRLGDSANQIRAHRHLGDAYARIGEYPEAIQHLTRALHLAEQTDDRRAQAYTHFNLSWAWNERGDGRQALVHITAALRLFRAFADPVGEADALNAAGWIRAHIGEHEQAQDDCEHALTLARQHHLDEIEANALDSLGYIAHQGGRHRHAIAHYHQALALFRDLRDTYNEANTLANLGEAHTAYGQRAQARTAWQEALDLYRTQDRTAEAETAAHKLAELAAKSRTS